MTKRHDKIRADHDAGLGQRAGSIPQGSGGVRALVPRRLFQDLSDAHLVLRSGHHDTYKDARKEGYGKSLNSSQSSGRSRPTADVRNWRCVGGPERDQLSAELRVAGQWDRAQQKWANRHVVRADMRQGYRAI